MLKQIVKLRSIEQEKYAADREVRRVEREKAEAIQRKKDEIERKRSYKEEELFLARLRFGMLNSGEVVYQFPHGRDNKRRLEEPAQ